MNLQPKLENDMVMVRPLSTDDYDALFLAASDPAIWEQHTTNNRWLPEGFQTFFEESIQSKGALVILDKTSNSIIGSSRYHIEEGITDAVEIGWSFLTKTHWGGGYNRAFKSLMINHALEFKDNVLFLIAFDNIRSQKATEKLGGIKASKENYPLYFRKGATHFTYLINKENWSI